VSNSNTVGGYKSASFAAIWSMLLVIAFTSVGGRMVVGGKSSPLLVGFLIGVAIMLAELFFVLMIIFFIFGTNAVTQGIGELSIFLSLVLILISSIQQPVHLTKLMLSSPY
jgi:hypothetical protein